MPTYQLPYPPSANRIWRTHKGRTLLSKNARDYRKAVTWCLRTAQAIRLEGRLSVEITVHPPDKRRRDIDNVVKPILDALQYAGLYDDDSQIDRLLVQRSEQVAGGNITVSIHGKG